MNVIIKKKKNVLYILAEEKLKDRLALAAREKLAQATKEKQLQAERKRKAALFINMLKSSNQLLPHSNNSENAEGDHLEIGELFLYIILLTILSISFIIISTTHNSFCKLK